MFNCENFHLDKKLCWLDVTISKVKELDFLSIKCRLNYWKLRLYTSQSFYAVRDNFGVFKISFNEKKKKFKTSHKAQVKEN
jgi:hypothetical protein